MTTMLRNRLNEYMRTHGTTNVFIAKSIGVSDSLISRFRKGERNLGKQRAQALDLLLKSLT
jgi:predicted transcriptional regulator